jgi:hypothetical protein
MLEIPPPPPTGLDFRRVTVVQESIVDKSSGILLAFLTIPPKYIGPYMLSPRRNALPKLSPTSKAPLQRHTLEFGTITNSQHLRSRIFFCPDYIEHCIEEPRRKWVDKFFADQERPPIQSVSPVKLGTNLTNPEILKLENVGFQLLKKERITPTRLFNTSAPPLDLSGVDVLANPDSYPSSR